MIGQRHRPTDRQLWCRGRAWNPKLVAPQSREVQARIEVANSTIQRWDRSNQRVAPLIEAEVRIVLADDADLTRLLQTGDRVERSRVYQKVD